MIDKFNDFIVGVSESSNNGKKPYIYVMEYILSKDNSFNELKEYITNYEDDDSDYEDDASKDPFMEKLKILADDDNLEEIEEMIISYDEYSDNNFDYDDDDDDFEEKMYNKDFVEDKEDIIDDYEQIENEIETSNLSDQLKDFLKIDIEFEDLGKENEAIDIEFDELGQNITFEKREEILNSKYDKINEDWEIYQKEFETLGAEKQVEELIKDSIKQDEEYGKKKKKNPDDDIIRIHGEYE